MNPLIFISLLLVSLAHGIRMPSRKSSRGLQVSCARNVKVDDLLLTFCHFRPFSS